VRRLLIVANETVAGRELLDAIEQRAGGGALDITVLCPISEPRGSYVVDPDAVRAAAAERLERTLGELRDNGIEARGFVVDAGPLDAVRDHVAHEAPDEVIVSTHPTQQSRWLRRDVVEQMRRFLRDIPVEHVVVDQARSEVVG
jgi:GABA permease